MDADAGVDGGWNVSITPPLGACTADGWCWDSPIPVGTEWRGVWAADDGEVWAVGRYGQTYHLFSGQWTLVPTGVVADLNAVYGFAPDDVWAVGSTVLHWDGGAWGTSSVGAEEFFTVWGAGPSDVWIGGSPAPYSPMVYHYDGASWTNPRPSGLNNLVVAIWGTSSDDVWFNDQGDLWYWDGGTVAQASSVAPGVVDTWGLWGSAPNSYWAGGWGSALLHWDGGVWAVAANPGNLRALWGSSDQDIWGVGSAANDAGVWPGRGSDLFHGNNYSWTTEPAPTTSTLLAVHGSSASNVWAAGTSGALLHFDGGAWAQSQTQWALTGENLNTIWGTGPTNVWAGGDDGGIFHWDGGAWALAMTGGASIASINGSGPNDVWAVGPSDALHFDGTSWSQHTSGLDAGFSVVWAASPSEAWASGPDGMDWSVYHWTSSGGWSRSPNLSTGMHTQPSLWGSGPNDVYAGTETAFVHWDGGAWGPVTSTASGFWGQATRIWGTSAHDVYAAQPASSVVHWDGTGWSLVGALTGRSTAALSGSGPNDVWALGGNSLYALHWDGSTWTTSTLPNLGFVDLYVGSPHVLWTVGVNGHILRHAY
jgi:hypothetical protein